MKKNPGWYDDEIAHHAKLVLNDGETEDQALVSLRVLVRDTHREFGNIVIDKFSAPQLATAIAVLRSRRAAELRAELAEAKTQARRAEPSRPARGMLASLERGAPVVPQSVPLQPAPPLATQEMPEDRIAALEDELAKVAPPADPDWELHRTLFPDFAFRSLRVTPERYAQVHEMTGHQLDMARNILRAKTQNAIDGANDERNRFERFYNKVRPLMNDDDTVADAERKLSAAVRSREV